MLSRRKFLKTTAGSLVLAGAGSLITRSDGADAVSLGIGALPSGTLEEQRLEALPSKRPLLKKTYRPPNFETPVDYFKQIFTPNDAFFVRYHLSNIPEINAATWKLRIGGEAVQNPLEFTLDDLKKDFEQVEITAVCQCAGNRRGLFQPHVPGVQWGYGAMGNARWQGVRLRDVLSKVGLNKEALEVVLDGADTGVLEKTPDFIKSLPLWKALEENTLIALAMNGEPLPHWNGFPARVVIPGWTATYWVKHLTSIQVVTQPFAGFWMKTAYRLPKGKFPIVDRFLSQETDANMPITEMVVNSLIISPSEGQRFKRGQPITVTGIAWDGGYGIQRVEVTTDGGKSWQEARLGDDLGRFAWRPWRFELTPASAGKRLVMARATNRIGATQTFELLLNPAGYHHNVVQRVNLDVV